MRVYKPDDAPMPSPLLLYFHGGGFVLGSRTSHHGLCSFLSERARCTVVHADYRLAPEHPFPAAVDDALTAFRWVAAHADELGCRADRIAMGGDSAGGNLTASVSLLLRGAAAQPVFQLMIYPAVDLTRSMPSHGRFADGYYLTAAMIDWFLERYLSRPADALDPRASPWFAEDVSGLPPALVLTAGFDPLRDEGKAWAERLEAAGVKVEHRCCEGLIHGFAVMSSGIVAAREALEFAALRLGEALAG